MRAIILLFALCVPWRESAGQVLDSNLTIRLQVELIAANATAALQFSNALRVAVPAGEVRDPENKAAPTEVRQDGDGQIRILSTFILRDYTVATNLARSITAVRNTNLTGRLQIHCCPLEGRIKDWSGCDIDPRAKPLEIKL